MDLPVPASAPRKRSTTLLIGVIALGVLLALVFVWTLVGGRLLDSRPVPSALRDALFVSDAASGLQEFRFDGETFTQFQGNPTLFVARTAQGSFLSITAAPSGLNQLHDGDTLILESRSMLSSAAKAPSAPLIAYVESATSTGPYFTGAAVPMVKLRHTDTGATEDLGPGFLAFFPDDAHLVYSSFPRGIVSRDLSRKTETVIAEKQFLNASARVSPDGRTVALVDLTKNLLIAYRIGESGLEEIRSVPAPDPQAGFAVGTSSLYVLRTGKEASELWQYPLTEFGDGARVLAAPAGYYFSSFAL